MRNLKTNADVIVENRESTLVSALLPLYLTSLSCRDSAVRAMLEELGMEEGKIFSEEFVTQMNQAREESTGDDGDGGMYDEL